MVAGLRYVMWYVKRNGIVEHIFVWLCDVGFVGSKIVVFRWDVDVRTQIESAQQLAK